MTKSELIKEIEFSMDCTGAMIHIGNLGICIKDYRYVVYGINRYNGFTYFWADYSKYGLLCPVKWNRFKKADLQEIYERVNSKAPEMYSRKDDNGYYFYKIWL